jgi:ribosome biogenesis GTPase
VAGHAGGRSLSPRDLDEDDIRFRARGGSRRRTRERPSYEDAREALVLAVDRGRYGCWVDGQEVTAVRGADARRSPVVVGDHVSLVGDTSGDSDTLARIVRVQPRRTVLRRSPDDTDPVERPVVANADRLVCVVALADPAPHPRLIDRVLVAAYDGGLEPVLCLTKTDLAAPDELLAAYTPLGMPVVAMSRAASLEPLLAELRGRTSVLFGHSGVGKSTLVNRLVPGAGRATGGVNEVTGRGRHTSSSVLMMPLPDHEGWVVDTPGIRSFGLGHVAPDRVVAAFPDLGPAVENCPPGCTHAAGARDCALDVWVAQGHAEPARLESLRRLLAARESGDE